MGHSVFQGHLCRGGHPDIQANDDDSGRRSHGHVTGVTQGYVVAQSGGQAGGQRLVGDTKWWPGWLPC